MKRNRNKSGQTFIEYLLAAAFFCVLITVGITAINVAKEKEPIVQSPTIKTIIDKTPAIVQRRGTGVTVFYLVAEDGSYVEVSPGEYSINQKGSEFKSDQWRK